MRIKIADDKSKRITLLEDLRQSPRLDFRQKEWLQVELMRLEKGIQGEREAAFYLDSYFKDGPNHAVLHDLRLVVDDEVAQIDHLIINRSNHFFLLETKNYACDLEISERGEFTADYGSKRFGIESPIEQSIRHERVLCKLLERLDISGRTQKLPEFHHVVMFHPKAIITRPPTKVFDTHNVIKADQFPTWHKRFADQLGVGSVFNALLNIRSQDTVMEWGEKLMRQHRPADLMALPDFMKPRAPLKAAAPIRVVSPSIPSPAAVPVVQPLIQKLPATGTVSPAVEPVKRLICAHCGVKISYPEGKFCWNNVNRFGGLAYCREHQPLIQAS
jgi:hypothetical protein